MRQGDLWCLWVSVLLSSKAHCLFTITAKVSSFINTPLKLVQVVELWHDGITGKYPSVEGVYSLESARIISRHARKTHWTLDTELVGKEKV